MPSIRTNPDEIAWTPWTEVFGNGAFYEGKPIIEVKTLSDRRAEGGGVAYLLRFRPPAGKLIKVVDQIDQEELARQFARKTRLDSKLEAATAQRDLRASSVYRVHKRVAEHPARRAIALGLPIR